MKRLLIIIILSIVLGGCSSQAQVKEADSATAEALIDSAQDNYNEPVSDTGQMSEAGASSKNQPNVNKSSNLKLPSDFPSSIVLILEDANIINTYSDEDMCFVSYQTGKSFDEVKNIYKKIMDGSKPIMEDSQGEDYYSISRIKDKINVFITITKNTPDITSVEIATNNFDMSGLDMDKAMTGSGSGSE